MSWAPVGLLAAGEVAAHAAQVEAAVQALAVAAGLPAPVAAAAAYILCDLAVARVHALAQVHATASVVEITDTR